MPKNMKYRLAVCDDNETDIKYITSLISGWSKASGNIVELHAFPSGEAFLFEYEDNKSYDILLLDIEMGGMNGVELAGRIRKDNRTVQIIFVTGYMEYIGEGYDVEALHYLIKPVTQDKISAVLDRGAERLKYRENTLLLTTADGTVRVPLYEIRYLEVYKNYVTVHAEEEYTVKKTLNEMERELDDSFFRTGRSFIINLRFVKKVTRADVYLKDGTVVPLSKNLYEDINRAIIRYF